MPQTLSCQNPGSAPEKEQNRREVGGRTISVDRHLHHLYLFMGVEKAESQEQIRGLDEDGATGILALDAETHLGEAHNEFTNKVVGRFTLKIFNISLFFIFIFSFLSWF